MILVQKISSKQTYIIRHPILRLGKPIESCRFDGDDLDSTTHFGLFVDENIVGIISLFQNKNNIFAYCNQFQIRGMAVLNEFQHKGLGRELVLYCENYILTNNGDLVWLNARENAVNFYEKLGYKIIGNAFNIREIGKHFTMYKKIV